MKIIKNPQDSRQFVSKTVSQEMIAIMIICAFAVCSFPAKAQVGLERDTIVATNHNVRNFKKGFAGDKAISVASNNPFYKLDVIAKQGEDGITSIFAGSTVNGSGQVLFSGRNPQGAAVFVGDSINAPRPIATNITAGAAFSGTVQLTDNNKSISLLNAQGAQSLIVGDSLDLSFGLLVATSVAAAQDRFDQVNAFASVDRFGKPVFSGFRGNVQSLVSGYRFGYTFLKNYPPGIGGMLRPMVADNGIAVIREIETGSVQRIVLFNYGLPGVVVTIADENQFVDLGVSPGISDDGNVVVFQGNLRPDGTSGYNNLYQTTSGPGIFASIDLGGGNRKIVRLAGIKSQDMSQTAPLNYNGICEANEICIEDELGYAGSSTGSGNPIKFGTFDPSTRVGVARQESGAAGLADDSFVTTFIATPNEASPSALFSNQTGLWAVRTDIKTLPDGTFDYVVGKAKPVIQINDTIDGSVVTQLGIYDPISNATNNDLGAARPPKPGDHRIAFWAQTNTGPMMVRGTFFDTDEDGLPDHWEENGVTIGGELIDLPAMGASSQRKDIFVQVNWLDANGGIVFKPRAGALQRVIESFKNAPVSNPDGTTGISIHIDAGPNSIMNTRNGAKWNTRSRAGSFIYGSSFGSSYPGTTRYDWKDFDLFKFIAPNGQNPQTDSFFVTGRAPIFRLALFVDTWDNRPSSGKSRSIPSTDFMISLGQYFPPQTGVRLQWPVRLCMSSDIVWV